MAHNVLQLTDDNFEDTIKNGITLVDFHAVWCAPCKMIAPIIQTLAVQNNGKACVAKIDIDESPMVSTKLQITSVPTLILFKAGKEVKRVVGVKDIDFLQNLIDSNI